MNEEIIKQYIFSIMKGYNNPFPYDLYLSSISLITINDIYINIDNYDNLDSLLLNTNIKEEYLSNVKEYETIVSHILAVSMIKKEISFNVENTSIFGHLEVDFNDLDSKAYKLGTMLKTKDIDDIDRCLNKEKDKIVILQSDSIGLDVDISKFYNLGNVTIYKEALDSNIIEYCKDATIIVTNKNKLDSNTLSRLPNLKLICLFATGYNNVDIDYCHSHNIQVRNVKGYSTDTVAQHTLSLALHLIEKNNLYDKYVKSKQYSNNGVFSFFDYPIHDLSSLTWGIVGLGDIGKKVYKIVEAFGSNVQYYSTSGNNSNANYHQVDFETLLTTSDIISIHAPLNDNTYHLFNYQTMSKTKKHSYLINVGRGPIINEVDLVKLLNEDHFDGVGLDVYEKEPLLANSPLLSLKNMDKVIYTPHVAWGSIEARNRLIEEVYLNIESYLQGKDRNIV